ncbi:MAG: response regulator transcription factor [Actinomycetota bacterium]|nr:response regulator transcription factor [Actinomycetota bacterium]
MQDEASPPARLLIADDHTLVRKGMRAMLENQPDLEVIGEAEDGQEALELCREQCPDLVLMDVRMPKMDGLAATQAIKEKCPQTSVLIVTTHEDQEYLLEALKRGAAGYLLKEASQQQLISAVRRVLQDETSLDQELARRLILRLADEAQTEKERSPAPPGRRPLEERPEPPPLPEAMSSREVEVLKLIARGQTNHQIAENLLVSTSTVKKHVRQIVLKLNVSDRTQAAVRAIELGLLSEQERQ